MTKIAKDGHEKVRAMLDRIDKNLEGRPRHDFARTDRDVRHVTKLQMGHYRVAGYISLVGIVICLSLPFFTQIRWYWSIPIALVWALVWTQISNRAIVWVARLRVRRLAMAELSERKT